MTKQLSSEEHPFGEIDYERVMRDTPDFLFSKNLKYVLIRDRPSPVDEEGIPLYTLKTLSRVLQMHEDSLKKWTATKPIPHLKELKGLGGSRTYFRLREVYKYLQSIQDPRAIFLLKELEHEVDKLREDKIKGNVIYTLYSPHPTWSRFAINLRFFGKNFN